MKFNGGRCTESSPFGVKSHMRLVLPQEMAKDMFNLVHHGELGGHMGKKEPGRD